MNLLKDIRERNTFLPLFTKGLSALWDSGIFPFLREKGQVKAVSPNSDNYLIELATQAEYSRGYNDALDDILNFRERYLDPVAVKKTTPTYGAIESALKAGDLTEKEANELRSK